jgi:hypothetical protein
LRIGKHDVTFLGVGKREEVDYRLALGRALALGELVHLELVGLAEVGKEEEVECVEVVRKVVTKSSSLVSRSITPTPPRFCLLNSSGLVRLT